MKLLYFITLSLVKSFSPISTITPNIGKNINLLFNHNLNTFRINFNDNHQIEQVDKLVNVINSNNNRESSNIIMFELKNPDINIGDLDNLYLSKGSIFKLDYNLNKGDQNRVYFPLCQYIHDLLIDQIIYLNQGQIKLKIIQKSFCLDESFEKNYLITQVCKPGFLQSYSSVNVPHFNPSEFIFNNQNFNIINLAKQKKIDYLIIPWIKNKKHLDLLKINYLNNYPFKIIMKIDSPQSFENLQSIINYVDGIMICRKDLEIMLGQPNFKQIKDQIVKISKESNKPLIMDYQTINFI